MPNRNISKRRLFLFKLLLSVFGIGVGLLLAEIGLRVVESARTQEQEAFSEKFLLKDSRLIYRLAPGAKGHDANGFRNDSVPASADIVALGDSQTWGVNAERDDTWPKVLARTSGRSVYNMGVSGYGPVQFWALMQKALSFRPKVIVVTIYTGNDLYDAYNLAYTSDDYKSLRAVEVTEDLSRDTVGPRCAELWNEEKNFQQNYGRGEPRMFWLWLSGHTAVGRLLVSTRFWPGNGDIWFEASKAWAKAHPDHGSVYDESGVRTVMTTEYRLLALDLDNPRIAEGLRITRDVLQRISSQAEANKARVFVLQIPTKEFVFAGVQPARQLDSTYERLVKMESRVRDAISETCNAKGIAQVDALAALVDAVRRGEPVYGTSTEGHPSTTGYRVIAATVDQALKRQGW